MENKKFNICIVGGGSRYTPGILRMLVGEKNIVSQLEKSHFMIMKLKDRQRLELMDVS